jgi:predicted TPR repeat methyltransferase
MADESFLDRVYERADGDANHRLYAEWAGTYDTDLTENGYATPARVAAVLADLVDDHEVAVLDVGCGTGLSGRALADRGFTTIDGVDYSGEMLEVAARAGCYRHLAAVDLNESAGDLETDAYGAVACVGAFGFGHVEAAALDDLLRVTRPGGAIAIGVNEPYWLESDLSERLDAAAAAHRIVDLTQSQGDHIPGHEVAGWVLSMRVPD